MRRLGCGGSDPTAATNHGYFDVLAFHSYDEVVRMYQLPLGYLGMLTAHIGAAESYH